MSVIFFFKKKADFTMEKQNDAIRETCEVEVCTKRTSLRAHKFQMR